uniref:Uncharacterized protein n=1 Tax=Cacopsylla melanoneura TaxID=428564 RepID=A0A8D8YP56_9HEMI
MRKTVLKLNKPKTVKLETRVMKLVIQVVKITKTVLKMKKIETGKVIKTVLKMNKPKTVNLETVTKLVMEVSVVKLVKTVILLEKNVRTRTECQLKKEAMNIVRKLIVKM